jgi:Cft2 family RNA processing exonuclease
MRMLLADYIKLVNVSTEDVLYDENDLNACIEKIELIDYHQVYIVKSFTNDYINHRKMSILAQF